MVDNSYKYFLVICIYALAVLLFSTIGAYAQCPDPSTTGNSRCGDGQVNLQVSGSTGYYGWQDASGAILDSGNTFTTPVLSSTTGFYAAAYDTITSNSLFFDGTNDYVAIQNMNYTTGGHTELTVEAWVRTTNGGDHIIASFDRNEYWRLEINGNGAGTGQVGWDLMTNAGQLDFGSVSRVDDGSWHHVAGVFDNGNVYIYIDGNLDNSTTMGATFGSGNARFGYIGVGSESPTFDANKGPTSYFDGDIDEVRIWNVARSQTDIRNNMRKCVAGTPGLQVNYTVDDGSGTTLTDNTGNGFNGTLRNGTAWQTTGPYIFGCCQSNLMAATATINPIPPVDLGVDGCFADSVDLNAGAGHTTHLWNDGSGAQTLRVYNTGQYFVEVNDGGVCDGYDTINVSIVHSPSAIDNARCGDGPLTIGVSGGAGNYIWYDSPTGGVVIDTGNAYTTPVLSSTTTYYVASTDNAPIMDGLAFDGVDDYVALNAFFNTSGRFTQLTVEGWVRTSESGTADYDNWAIIDFDRSEYFNLYVRGDNGEVGFSTNDNTNTIHDQYTTGVAVNDGNWHHVAAVYDGVDKIIYVDGVEVHRAVNAHNGRPLGNGVVRYGFIGEGSEASGFNGTRNDKFFNGAVDNVRVWETARTPAEINQLMTSGVCFSQTGLLLNYTMDDGAGSSVLTDHSGNGLHGQLFNMNTTTAWITDGPFQAPCCTSNRIAVTATINPIPQSGLPSDTCSTSSSVTLDAGGGFASYLWQDGSTNQTLSINTNGTYWVEISDGTCTGRDSVLVSFAVSPTSIAGDTSCGPKSFTFTTTGSNDLFKWYDAPSGGNLLDSGKTFTTPVLSSTTTYYVSAFDNKPINEGLRFDGSDDYVAVNYSFSASGALPTLTAEGWVRTTESSTDDFGNWAIIDFDRSEYFNLFVRGDNGEVGFSTTANNNNTHDQYTSGVPVNDGNWHHVVGVYDGNDKIIYVDGIEVARATNAHGGRPLGTGTTRFGVLGDGSESAVFDGTRNNEYFDGDLSQVRVWSKAKTAAQIQAGMGTCIDGSENGLILYLKLDDGAGSSMTVDYGPNSANGTLRNMNITNAWLTDGPTVTGCECESPRVAVTAVVHPAVMGAASSVSCPMITGDVQIVINGSGGSGDYDFEEISGAFAFAGSYDATPNTYTLTAGNTYDIRVMDQNGCEDTFSVATNAVPTQIAPGTTSGSCEVPGLNEWVYIVDPSNDAIIMINDNGDNLGTVSADLYRDASVNEHNGDAYLQRHYVINTANAPSMNVKVRFLFNNTELNNLIVASNANSNTDDDVNNIGDIDVTKYSGPTEDGIFSPGDATAVIYIQQNNNGTVLGENFTEIQTSSFSEFWLHHSDMSEPLPVEYTSFTATPVNNNVVLEWSTSSEKNNSHFVIQRSKDANSFEDIDIVNGSGTSNQINSYSFVDKTPYSGASYYRLMQVDYDGNYSYSELKTVNINAVEAHFNVYPNPANGGRFNIALDGYQEDKEVLVVLLDPLGNQVYSKIVITNQTGAFITAVDPASDLPSGVYTIIGSSDGKIFQSRIVIQ